MATYNTDINNLGFGFGLNVSVGKPLDSRVICDDASDLLSFNKGVLYVGLVVYVINEGSQYVCTNTNSTNNKDSEWVKLGGSGGGDTSYSDGYLVIIGSTINNPISVDCHSSKDDEKILITDDQYNDPSTDKDKYNIQKIPGVLLNGSYVALFDGAVVMQTSTTNIPWLWYGNNFTAMTMLGDQFNSYWQGLIYASL